MKKWKSADGKYHDVKDMTTIHIKICLKLLENDLNNPEYIDPPDDCNFPVIFARFEDPEEWIERFEKELKRRNNGNWSDLDCTFDWIKRKNKYVETIKRR